MQVAGTHFVRTGWPHITTNGTCNTYTIGVDAASCASTVFYQVTAVRSSTSSAVTVWPTAWLRCDQRNTAWTDTTGSHAWDLWQQMPHRDVRITGGETPEQRQARELQEACRLVRLEEEAKREAERRMRAGQRAKSLLLATMTPEQRASYERHGHFDVRIDGKTYRIKQGSHGNVSLVDERGPIERYCVQPSGVPVEDMMLAQKLALECAPAEFFRKANVTRIRN